MNYKDFNTPASVFRGQGSGGGHQLKNENRNSETAKALGAAVHP